MVMKLPHLITMCHLYKVSYTYATLFKPAFACTNFNIIMSATSLGATLRHPIPLSLFPSHVEWMSTNENCGFVEEYNVK